LAFIKINADGKESKLDAVSAKCTQESLYLEEEAAALDSKEDFRGLTSMGFP